MKYSIELTEDEILKIVEEKLKLDFPGINPEVNFRLTKSRRGPDNQSIEVINIRIDAVIETSTLKGITWLLAD